ncbi:MAG: Predicted integral membrane protein, partial [uncultured Thermomicrobiales bacterium]
GKPSAFDSPWRRAPLLERGDGRQGAPAAGDRRGRSDHLPPDRGRGPLHHRPTRRQRRLLEWERPRGLGTVPIRPDPDAGLGPLSGRAAAPLGWSLVQAALRGGVRQPGQGCLRRVLAPLPLADAGRFGDLRGRHRDGRLGDQQCRLRPRARRHLPPGGAGLRPGGGPGHALGPGPVPDRGLLLGRLHRVTVPAPRRLGPSLRPDRQLARGRIDRRPGRPDPLPGSVTAGPVRRPLPPAAWLRPAALGAQCLLRRLPRPRPGPLRLAPGPARGRCRSVHHRPGAVGPLPGRALGDGADRIHRRHLLPGHQLRRRVGLAGRPAPEPDVGHTDERRVPRRLRGERHPGTDLHPAVPRLGPGRPAAPAALPQRVHLARPADPPLRSGPAPCPDEHPPVRPGLVPALHRRGPAGAESQGRHPPPDRLGPADGRPDRPVRPVVLGVL